MAIEARIDAAIDGALAEQRIVGTEVLVAQDGELIYARAAGLADREAGRPMERNDIFRLASLTKPLVAATALAMVEHGLCALDDAVSDYLSYFQPMWKGQPARITIRQLLTHTSGLSYDGALLVEVGAGWGLSGPIVSLEENTARIGRMKLKFAPGTGWEYSVATDVLGCLVAAINRSSLDEAVQRYVTVPLAMNDTRFHVTDPARLAAPYDGPPVPVRMSDPHRGYNPDGSDRPIFSPSRIFDTDAPQSGGAGMVGTGGDFLKFVEAIRTGDPGILSEKMLAEALRNQIGDLPRSDAGWRFGFLGAVLDDPIAAGSPAARGTVSWGGVYGHNWFVDRVNRLSVVSMSNTAYEGCNGRYPDQIRDAIYRY